MKVEIFTILILDILVIGGITLDDVVIEYNSHTNNYDITTIYKKTSGYSGGEESNQKQFNITKCFGCYDANIYLRTNAIGMPIKFNGSILSSNKKSLEFIADGKYPTTIYTRNQIEYNIINWSISNFSIVDPTKIVQIPFYYELLLWDASSYTESFKIKWKQRNSMKMCISVSYLLEDESKCTFSMDLTDEDSIDKQVIYSTFIKESKVLSTVLFKKQSYHHYRGWVDSTVYAEGCKIGIKRIAQCTDEYEDEEILTIKTEELRSILHEGEFLTFDVYPFDAHTPQMVSALPFTECANGGFSSNNGCTCPPGFKGNKCEHGCGPNTYGIDCTGICSIRQTQCRQMMFCTKDFGCNCPAGYRGDDCNTECTSGTYGVNCNQLCSKQCLTSCDAYTGVCNKGCAASYIAPDCKEKYPWLKSPPELESSDLKSLKLKIDFNSENIQGSRNVNSIYYQILFKITSNESEFTQLELKEIRQQNSVIEFIDNLKPGISYSFGVMLVAEDGNSNIEDMKIVNYTTKCLLSRDFNYNVSLLSGTDYINVTWNKLNDQNEEDCYIRGYFLKLMMMNTQQLHYSEEVIFNDNHGYVFKNLLYGEKYAVQVTAISATGRAKASEISYVYTEPYGFVQVKNIKAKLKQCSSLIITWDVEEKYASMPLHYNVKYKINKHFSCSNEVIKNNWTSLLVYNQTQIEIWDLIPNTQYVIKVEPAIKGYTYDDNVNIIFVKTPISNPKLTPIIINDENSSYITNHSAYFNWTINKTECSKLNGLFQGYQVILKDIVEGTQVLNFTTQNTVNYDELKLDTEYELQLYVVTNYGYNLEQGSLIKFKTKTKLLKPVDDLIVYKKNLKRKSIGIRWSFPNENIINGFIVSTIDENMNSTKQITIDPERCVVWQQLYCTTLENLIPNHQYTIKIKAKSIDYPTGGHAASIVSNFNDGFADKPENFRATDVGSTHISLEWDIPWIFNGVLKSFIVSTEEISSKDIDKCCDSQPDLEIPITEELPTYNCTIKDLKPGSTYSIGVLAKTSSYGLTNKIHVTTLSTPAVAEDVENDPLITPATQTSNLIENILTK
ncbi:hypothetical protein QTP88_012455 [Uroleucon formosanum]